MTLTRQDIEQRFDKLTEWIQSVVSPFGEVEGTRDRDERKARARTDFAYFLHTYFPHYARQADPEFLAEIEEVCNARNKPQMVLGFRGCAKSTLISLVHAAHEILYGTAHFFVFASRSRETAAAEYTVPLKAELQANVRIRNDFGILPVRGEETDFVVGDRDSTRVRAAGIRSFPRGMKHGPWRIDRIRLEDFEDQNNRMSPAMQKKYMAVIQQDIMQSVGSGIDEQWSIIVNANYFSKRSLIHRLRTSGLFRVTIIRALRPLRKGERRADAIDGEVSTWPERYPTAELWKIKLGNPVVFAVEWQQDPDDDESSFRREWFRYYKPGDLPPHAVRRLAWIDPSPGEKDTSDYKAYGYADFYMIDGELHMYLLEASVRQETVNQMVGRVIDMQKRNPTISLWGWEEVSGEMYLQKLITRVSASAGVAVPLFPVMKQFPGFAWKKDRIPQMQSWLEQGRCHFLKGNADHERIIEHYLDWPEGLHDDGADFHSGLWKMGELMAVQDVVL